MVNLTGDPKEERFRLLDSPEHHQHHQRQVEQHREKEVSEKNPPTGGRKICENLSVSLQQPSTSSIRTYYFG